MIAVLVAGASLSGCSTLCGGFKPFYVSEQDQRAISRGLKDDLTAHNEHGEKQRCEGFVPSQPNGLLDLFNR